MSSADMQQLASALNFATLVAEFPSKGRNGRHSCEECGSSAFPAPRSWSLNTKQIVAVTSIILVDSCLLTGTLLRAFFLLLHFSFGLVALSFILAYLLRVCAADLYMKGSDVFAKYNSMFGVQDIYYRDNVAGKSTYATSSSQSKKALQMNILKMPTSKSAQSDIKIEVRFDRNESERSLQWVLLTGATGFLGSLLLRDLLLHREPLSIMGGVIVVCRSKGDNSGKDRISNLLSDPMFSFLSEKDKNDLVLVLEGDVTLPNAGINSKDLDNVCNKMNVSHVFHCAAAVNFTQAMEDAASSNILTSLNMQSLTKRLRNKTAKYVHISTAFVHGDATGTQTTPLPEELFQLKNYDALDVYQSMLETQSYASTAMDELGFPNTYTFSKSICEHLLVREQGVETIIIRPSIIGPALQEPFEGWAGMMPSTIVAVACLYFKWQWNFWCCGEQRVPVIPVDVVCKFILAKAFNGSDLVDVCKYKPDEIGVHLSGFSISSFGSNSVDDNRKCKIYNAAWDTSSNQTAMFRWRDFAAAITHFGSVLGYTSRSVAYIAFSVAVNLLPRMSLTVDTFRILHQFFIKAPINSTIAVLEWVGWNPHSVQQLSKLNTFIDLPLLLFPFTNNNFYFRSDLVSPDDMNGERYLFSCIVAADRFLSTVPLKYKRRAEGKHSSVIRLANDDQTVKLANDRDVQSLPCVLVVGGRQHKRPTSDIWWALTQPRGDIFIRAVGWIWIKILRACCISVTIDAASFSHLAISRTSDSGNGLPHVILAPTHRSFFDFLLISYVYFSVPELLGPDIPHIVAADDFARLPMLGWAARNARALFLRRGRGVADPALNDMIRRLKVKKCDGSAACIEVFIEGSRSRDRRFLKPKTGFLRCLAETGGDHVVVPISISYERIPEQSTLSFDAERGSKVGLRSQGLLWWLKRVFTRKINIGRVHIAAVQPLRMEESSGELDFHALSRDIQRKQQLSVHVSNYHIEAGANVLGVKTETLREALSVLGCNFWPSSAGCSICSESGPDLGAPRSLSEQWTVMLQYGHLLSPLFRLSHPYWCEWLNPSFDLSSDYSDSDDPAVQSVASALSKLFDTADNATEMAIQLLLSNGYQTPKIDHVMQSIESYASTQVPPLLLRAAVSMKLSTRNTPPPTTASPTSVVTPVPTISTESPTPSPSTHQPTTPLPTASPTAVVTPVPTISTKSPTPSPNTQQPTITSPDPTESTTPTTVMTTSVPTNTIISAGASCQPAPTNLWCTLLMVSLLVIGGGWIGM